MDKFNAKMKENASVLLKEKQVISTIEQWKLRAMKTQSENALNKEQK